MTDDIRRSNNAAGIFLVAVVFIVETSVLDHAEPRAVTPYVLGLLGAVGLAALAAGLWYRRRAQR